MRIRNLIQAASITGAAFLLMAATASASTVTYSTNTVGTEFTNNDSLTLDNTSGVSSTLTFTPNVSGTSGTPSNIDLGDFELTCTTCTTTTSTTYGSFSFNLVVSDTTDGATGQFVGSSSGGTVTSDTSSIDIIWSPLELGPGTSNALTGNFNATDFTISSPTLVVAPNSGTPEGDTSVQAIVNSAAVPEPATLGLVGGALLALGIFRKRVMPVKS